MDKEIPLVKMNVNISKFDDVTGNLRYLIELEHLNFLVNENLKNILIRLLAYRDNTLVKTSPDIDSLSIEEISAIAKKHFPEELFEGGCIGKSIKPFIVSAPIIPRLYLEYITTVLSYLFSLPLMILFSSCFFTLHSYVLYEFLILDNMEFAPEQTGIFITLFLFSFLIHELGHASACKKFGQKHGSIGVGIYFIFPVFYADVTSAWRLNKFQRAVVDIGGVYFQSLMLLIVDLFVLIYDSDLAFSLSLTITIMMFHTLNPFFKFDGYWLLSDLSGITNLHDKVREVIFSYSRNIFSGEIAQPRKKIEKLILLPYALLTLVFITFFIWLLSNKLSKLYRDLPEQLLYWYGNSIEITGSVNYLESSYSLILIVGFPLLLVVGFIFYLIKMIGFFFKVK